MALVALFRRRETIFKNRQCAQLAGRPVAACRWSIWLLSFQSTIQITHQVLLPLLLLGLIYALLDGGWRARYGLPIIPLFRHSVWEWLLLPPLRG